MPDSLSSVLAVIEDDPDMRSLLATMARLSGHVVIEAANFEEGRDLLCEYPWDVAIIGSELRGGKGIDLCRMIAVRNGETHRHIVILGEDDSHEEKLAGFNAGADEYISKPFDVIELRARLRAITRSAAAQKNLLVRVSALEQLTVIDGLTQIYNHRFFQSELRRTYDLASRHQRPLALAMIDIDLFKRVNDNHGHSIGDQVLIEVSNALAETIRSCDTVARYGGEEFAIILPETTPAAALALAERARAAVESKSIETPNGRVSVTISIGCSAIPDEDIMSAARLLEAADRALYDAKAKGRNRVEAGFRISEGPAAIALAGR